MSTSASSKLLDAAVASIRHRGYAGGSVDDICRAAGVSKGAFVFAKADRAPEVAPRRLDFVIDYV